MTAASPPWLRALRGVRPLEAVWLGFFLYVFARAGPRAFVWWQELFSLRTRRMLIALAVVGAVHLARAYWNTPWPPEREGARRRFGPLFGLAVLPLVFALWHGLVEGAVRQNLSSLAPGAALATVPTALLHIVEFGLPTLFVWLSVGVALKGSTRFSLKDFLVTNLSAVGRGVREWAPLLLLLGGYGWMGAVIGDRVEVERDTWMAAADKVLFLGADPLDLLQSVVNRPLSEWCAFSYSFYAVFYPLCFGAIFLFSGNLAFRETAFAVGVAMLVAFVSYTLVPVKGPSLARTFAVPLDLYYIGAIKEALMDKTRITYDCFPSMHTGASVLMAWGCWRHARKVFWFILPMVATMPLACVYLRYHYVVDVLAGLAVALAVVPLTLKVCRAPRVP